MVETRDLVGADRKADGSEGLLHIHAPYDGQLVGTAPIAGADRAEEAVASAVKAFESWRFSPIEERQGLVRRVSLLVSERAEDLAQLLAVEVGKPITWAR